MFAFNVATFFLAVGRTSIANATVISALQPVALLLVTNRFFGERARAGDIFWSCVSIGGVALVVFGSVSANTGGASGDVLAFLAMLGYAGYYIASKHARRTLGAFEYQASLSVVATIALTPFVLLSSERLGAAHATDWLWVLAMVAIPGTGHLLTNHAHPYLRLSVLSLLTLLVPVGSTILAWVWLGETVSWVQAIGIVVVIAALAVVITGTSRSAVRAVSAARR
jgi:drug/metabolite transporter (DMT)-like permease